MGGGGRGYEINGPIFISYDFGLLRVLNPSRFVFCYIKTFHFQYPVTGPERSIRLQFLEVNTWTNLECLKRHSMPEWFRFYNGTLCAFARAGQGVCHGDSGSPLVASRQIIGFAVWERPCGRGVPDGYTRVSEFSGWIREVSGIVAV